MAKALIQGEFELTTKQAKASLDDIDKHAKRTAASMEGTFKKDVVGEGIARGGTKVKEVLEDVDRVSSRSATGIGKLFALEPAGIRRGTHALGELAGSLVDVGDSATNVAAAIGTVGRSLSLGLGAGIAIGVVERLTESAVKLHEEWEQVQVSVHRAGLEASTNPMFKSAEELRSSLAGVSGETEKMIAKLRKGGVDTGFGIRADAAERFIKFLSTGVGPSEQIAEEQGKIKENIEASQGSLTGLVQKKREELEYARQRNKEGEAAVALAQEEARQLIAINEASKETQSAQAGRSELGKLEIELGEENIKRLQAEKEATDSAAASQIKIAKIQADELLPARQKNLALMKEESAEADKQLKLSENLSKKERETAQVRAIGARARLREAEEKEYFRTPGEKMQDIVERRDKVIRQKQFERSGGQESPHFDISGKLMPPSTNRLYGPYRTHPEAYSDVETPHPEGGPPIRQSQLTGPMHMEKPGHMEGYTGSEEFKARFGEPERPARGLVLGAVIPSQEKELAAHPPPIPEMPSVTAEGQEPLGTPTSVPAMLRKPWEMFGGGGGDLFGGVGDMFGKWFGGGGGAAGAGAAGGGAKEAAPMTSQQFEQIMAKYWGG